ncbi:DUF2851 family protein [Rubritalea spongiae]|uniref:DUF2851 family protein n=1 Tax=Rubritalea spongiae TaxID=430797 RepID=A0ABW5E466_9BACT
MQSYSQLIQNTFPPYLTEEAPTDLPDELSLQALWFNGQFGREFTTTDQQAVTIKQFGFWNRSAGPDFLHCSIEINGEILSGPIELDTHASDWITHGHDSNPAFNEVILHVVFQDSVPRQFSRTENHQNVPKVVIPTEIISEVLQYPRHASATAHIGRCYQPLKNLSEPALESLLKNAAKHRCQLKAKRLLKIQEAHGTDQTLWIALAETLGYRPNKSAMSQLAQRLPIHYLKQHTSLSSALLFGTAGFLHPEIHKNAPKDSQQWLEELWQTWWQHRQQHELSPERSIQWTRSGIRPINHPQRRLAALSCVAQHWPTFRKFSSQTNHLLDWLKQLENPFWSHHYTLTSKRSEKKLSLIGKDRIRDLLINHILPLRIAEGDERAWNQYLNYPAPAVSESVNRASTRLFGQRDDKKKWLRHAWKHQALLQIYHDFCLEDLSDCTNCPFPEQLQQLT